MPRIKASAGVVLCALTFSGIAACGSTDSATSTSAQVVVREAGIAKKTNLKVVNRSGRDIVIDICHDGVCIGNTTLKDGEFDQAAGDDISGWVQSSWGLGNGFQDNQYTGVRSNATGPYQIDFSAGNPAIGLPWIEASLPGKCYYAYQRMGTGYGSPYEGSARWLLDVNDKRQSPDNTLCTYTMVGSREADGGADRVTGAPADYKMLTLEVYAPNGGYIDASRGCAWELTPGPISPPQSPDGSWSCWNAGPKPPSGTEVTYERVD